MPVFDEIQAHIEAGKDINQFHGEETALYYFLDSYYQLDINDDDKEIRLPLTQRKGNMYNQQHIISSFAHNNTP